jgi:hypothetical protein
MPAGPLLSCSPAFAVQTANALVIVLANVLAN